MSTLILTEDQIRDLYAATDIHPMRFTHECPGLSIEIAKTMRDMCPVSGNAWSKYMCVLLQPKMEVPAHAHKRHAMLFYPEANTEPVIVGGERIHPRHGEILHIPPGIVHSVPPVARTRLSIAMLIDD